MLSFAVSNIPFTHCIVKMQNNSIKYAINIKLILLNAKTSVQTLFFSYSQKAIKFNIKLGHSQLDNVARVNSDVSNQIVLLAHTDHTLYFPHQQNTFHEKSIEQNVTTEQSPCMCRVIWICAVGTLSHSMLFCDQAQSNLSSIVWLNMQWSNKQFFFEEAITTV